MSIFEEYGAFKRALYYFDKVTSTESASVPPKFLSYR